MKVKELYEFIKESLESGKIDPNSDVITIGEYDYGESLGKPYIKQMNLVDGRDIVKEHVNVLVMSIGAYLYECEDLGYSRMWVNNDDLQDLRDNDMLDENEDDEEDEG